MMLDLTLPYGKVALDIALAASLAMRMDKLHYLRTITKGGNDYDEA